MNGIVKVASRLSAVKGLINPLKQTVLTTSSAQGTIISSTGTRQFTRNLWHMCSSRSDHINKPSSLLGQPCSCGCGAHHLHTKAEKDLVDFLTDEIATEKKTAKKFNIPAELDGFKVQVDGAEVTLTKKSGNESVVVYFNVNHTVDAEVEAEMNPNMDKPDFAEMRSKPGFEVELIRDGQTLGFTCSFLGSEQQQQSDDGFSDLFGIDEITMYKGDEWNEKTYAVAGEIVDGNLYDLLMNLLEEKGVSNEFVDKLSDLSTHYEHGLYVSLLEKLQKFASGAK